MKVNKNKFFYICTILVIFLLLLVACSKENKKANSQERHVHNYEGWIVDMNASKTEDGKKHRQCTICDAVETEVIYAIGSQGLEYNLNYDNDGTCRITGFGTCKDSDVYVPVYIDGYRVKSVSFAFESSEHVKRITIAEGIEKIDDYAFYECKNLNDIVIPKSVTSIGDGAFEGCEKLNKVRIPEHVNFIGKAVFAYCYNLESIDVSKENTSYKTIDGNLYTQDGRELIQYAINNKRKTFDIPDGVAIIGELAFFAAKNLTEITLPESIIDIKKYAFQYCISLNNIDIPEGVETIGECAFRGCQKLKNILLPSSLKSIGKNAFEYCEEITSIAIPKGVTRIEENTFSSCSKLKTVLLTEGLIEIGFLAFASCNNIISLSVPSTVTYIDPQAFTASSLTKINIAEGNKHYKFVDNCLYNTDNKTLICSTRISHIIVKNGTINIGTNSFNNTWGIISITIPSSVSTIENKAIYNSADLEYINYIGTKEQWEKIEKAKDWFYEKDTFIIKCIDGNIKL